MADDIWLDGFERTGRAPTAYPGTMVAGAPRRFVCHFTQGLSRNPGASAGGHPNPPHLWVCLPSHPYRPGWRGQVYPLNVSARALNHDRTDPETNKQGAIQVEIEGYSEDAAGLSVEDLDWLADNVIGPACAATGVDPSVFIQGVGDSKIAAGRNSSTRMSWDAWRTFNGICSHQNVPGNDHWDAGGLDLAHISARLTGGNPTPEEDDMPAPSLLVLDPDGSGWWECFTGCADRRQVNMPFGVTAELEPLKFITAASGGPILGDETGADQRRFWMYARNPVVTGGTVDPKAIADQVIAAIGNAQGVDVHGVAKAVADELAARIQS